MVCATGLPLRVEPLLHEWQVYESGTDNFEKARTMFLENNGELLPNSPIQYVDSYGDEVSFSRMHG